MWTFIPPCRRFYLSFRRALNFLAMKPWDDMRAEFQQLSEIRRHGGLRAKDELHWLDLREALAQAPPPERQEEEAKQNVAALAGPEEIWELASPEEIADEPLLELSANDIAANESDPN